MENLGIGTLALAALFAGMAALFYARGRRGELSGLKAENERLQRRVAELTTSLARVDAEREASRAEMEQLVYTVSHDLKSPVSTTLGFLNLMREDLAEGRY